MAQDANLDGLTEESAAAAAIRPPRQAIEDLAAGKLRAFEGTIDPDNGEYLDDVYAQNKSLSEHVAADYHGRFLIELIQNGNDAHEPKRRDGEIEVRFVEDEGEHGTLYVANRGRPFTHDNLIALSRIGMSSKPPGEAIGNKGLGFRSVSHVCDRPEIYSQSDDPGPKPQFDGFCFTFARPHELDDLIHDPRVLELARRDLPIFFLPRPLHAQAVSVRRFAERGFASVVRLPLRSAEARAASLDEMALLGDESAPLLLFLDRLHSLQVSVSNQVGEGRFASALRREERQIVGSPVRASIVLLGSTSWLLTRQTVAEAAMRHAIGLGVAANQLHGSWTDWKGAGEVALAVRLDGEVHSPRLYTFLPMGEGATSPFPGHLHGTFFPTSNRKAVDASVALNRLLLQQAAALTAKSVRWLSGGKFVDPSLVAPTRACAAADFLTWVNPPSLITTKVSTLDRLDLPKVVTEDVAQLSHEPFEAARIVPCVAWEAKTESMIVSWRAPANSRSTFSESPTFNTRAAARYGEPIGITLLWPGLGAARRQRLVAFLSVNAPTGFREKMTAVERARIAGGVAGGLRAGRHPALKEWSNFYRDLPNFIEDEAWALAGQKIILCDDGSVRAGRLDKDDGAVATPQPRRRRRRSEQIEPSLFFPPAPRPVGEVDGAPLEKLVVPSQLAKYFAFAASGLTWHGDLRRTREFLEDTLVSAYDGEAVLTRIAQVVNSGVTVEMAIAGLRWAFAIWRRAKEVGRPIKVDRSYRLLVPSAEHGHIPATEAVFSESWPEATLGKRLQAFLSTAPPDVPDLADFRARRLAPTSHRAFGRARIPEWTEFLNGLGVRCGLQAVALPPMPPTRALEVTTLGFANALGVSDAAAAVWRSDLTTHMPRSLSLTYSTRYRFITPLWWLPGQGDHQRFSEACREIYAGLVVEWLPDAPNDVFRATMAHEHFTSLTHSWSTPLAAFLRSDEWLPADDSTLSGTVRSHYRPCDVWVTGATNDRFPIYLRQIAVSVGKAIERTQPEGLRRLVGEANLKIINAPTTVLDQASFLAGQFDRGAVSRHYEPQLVNLYNATWKAIADQYAADSQVLAKADPGMPLLARRGGELAVVIPGAKSAPPVYVRDSDDEIAASLVASIRGLMFDVKGADRGRIGRATDAIYGNKVSRISETRYGVQIDGRPLDALEMNHSVSVDCPWLRPMLAVSIEGLKGADAYQLPSDRAPVLARLATVGLHTAKQVVFDVAGQSVSTSADRSAYMFRRSNGDPIVVLLHEGALTWPALDRCLAAICEAIELPSVATGMRLLARELEASGEEVGTALIDDEAIERLCRTLYLDEPATAATRLLVGERIEARLPWIRAVLYYAGGSQALQACNTIELTLENDPSALVVELTKLVASTGLDVARVFDACRRAFAPEQFVDLLDLDFAAFNESLIASGSDPVTHPGLHAAQLANFIAEHEVEILQSLRNVVALQLDHLEAAPDYARKRDTLRSLSPDPAWLALYRVVPDNIVAGHVERWLVEAGAPLMGLNPHKLPALQKTRDANIAALGRLANTAAPLVRAWWRGPADSLPEEWRDGQQAEKHLRATLDAAGVIDFRPVDQAGLLAWCVRLGLWPAEMPASLERAVLGLGDQQVDAAEEAARREAAERAAKARSVRFNNRDIDPEEADWTEISAEIAENLSRRVKGAKLSAQTPLEAVEPRRSDGRPIRKTKRSPDPSNRVPQAKKDMIGRLGELVVYHWLKDRFRNQDIDKAWVSKNGAFQTGKEGSDELGYDFELEYDRRTWWIEVKASQGDSCQFEMGETEVRAARKAARPRSKTRYVIIYVANPGQPSATRIDVLPNPMSEESDGKLDLLGEGVRYGFRRQTS